jgi:hypothetical protein
MFYAHLTSGNHLDPELAPDALNTAVRMARDQAPQLPSEWAGYVHFGA